MTIAISQTGPQPWISGFWCERFLWLWQGMGRIEEKRWESGEVGANATLTMA